MAIEIPIPSWCRTIRIEKSQAAMGEIDVHAIGDVEGSSLLIYGAKAGRFILDILRENEVDGGAGGITKEEESLVKKPSPYVWKCSICNGLWRDRDTKIVQAQNGSAKACKDCGTYLTPIEPIVSAIHANPKVIGSR